MTAVLDSLRGQSLIDQAHEDAILALGDDQSSPAEVAGIGETVTEGYVAAARALS